MDSIVFIGINVLVGLALLFFGLKLMKFAVALMGFVLGYAITASITGGFAWPEWLLIAVPVIAGIALAAVAFTFYKIAVSLSISLFFLNLAYALAIGFGQGPQEAWFIALAVGIIAFIVVTVFKLVDVLFALSTASQGAGYLTMVLYGLFTSTPVGLLEGFHGVAQGTVLWVWALVWIGIAAVGFISQLSSRRALSSEA